MAASSAPLAVIIGNQDPQHCSLTSLACVNANHYTPNDVGDRDALGQSRSPTRERSKMAGLRIFCYLPNPRVWKATIAARFCGVDLEIRGASGKELRNRL